MYDNEEPIQSIYAKLCEMRRRGHSMEINEDYEHNT